MIRRLTSVVFFLATVGLAMPACCFARDHSRPPQPLNQPTRDAFAALFALPQGMIDGEAWSEQSDLEPPKDEAELIAALSRAKKAGARLNAYDHMGTLLHHALRGGEEEAALWLLDNGADPHLQVLAPDGKPDRNDAMALAIQYGRLRVIDKLLAQGYAAKSSEQEKASDWFSVLALPDGVTETRLTAKLLPRLPLPQDPDLDCLLTTALDTGNIRLALAFAARGRQKQTACLAYDNPFGAKVQPDRLDDLQAGKLAQAETDLQLPLFPALAGLVKSPADIDKLFALPLHRPFNDPAFTKAVLLQILPRPIDPALKLALLKRIPSSALREALGHDEVLPAWLAASIAMPRQDFPWMVQSLDSHATAQLWKLLMERSADTARTQPSLLEPLLAHLNKESIVWQTDLLVLPRTEWVYAYKLGYRPTAEHILAHLQGLRYQPPANLHADWQALGPISNATDRRQAWESLVRQFSVTCDDTGTSTKIQQFAQTLTAAGTRLGTPMPASLACQANLAFEELARLGVMAVPPAAHRPHFTLNATPCRASAGPGLLHHLANLQAAEFGDIRHIDAIPIPGSTDCAYLISSGDPGHRGYFAEDSSFYDGNIVHRPCLDPTYRGELFNGQGHSLGDAAEGAPNGLWPLQAAGKFYYLTASGDSSTCDSGRPPQLLAWQDRKLTLLAEASDLVIFLHDQCGMDKLDQCELLAGHALGTEEGRLGAANQFVDATFSRERAAFLEALARLDYAALKSARDTGITSGWLAAGLGQTSDSILPLEDRRKRIAWLFRERSQLASLLDDSALMEQLSSMIDWLPLADWAPVLQQGQCNFSLRSLVEDAKKHGKTELANHLQRAADLPCHQHETAQ